jgi:hypothetical protein
VRASFTSPGEARGSDDIEMGFDQVSGEVLLDVLHNASHKHPDELVRQTTGGMITDFEEKQMHAIIGDIDLSHPQE